MRRTLAYYKPNRPYIDLSVPLHAQYDLWCSVYTRHNIARILLPRLSKASSTKIGYDWRTVRERHVMGSVNDTICEQLPGSTTITFRFFDSSENVFVVNAQENVVRRKV
jgi:hypothetical protein